MLVLGITGGPELPGEPGSPLTHDALHDAAAALVDSGRVVRALEEERLTRRKHTHKAPISAIRYCLRDYGAKLDDVAIFAFYGSEPFINAELAGGFLTHPGGGVLRTARELHRSMLRHAFGEDVPDERFLYVPHHRAHALSAHALSGWRESLVVTLDWQGDDVAGEVYAARDHVFERLACIPADRSLGKLYQRVTSYLGYGAFDEYKVMGLAPYGDPSRLRDVFAGMFELVDGGDFALDLGALERLFAIAPPRRRDAPLDQVYKDVAAAAQETLETIVLHVVDHHRARTRLHHLCLAGGVAHNCTLNGRIVGKGWFDGVFVQPASSDAGCALGAALEPFVGRGRPISRLTHVYLGSDIGTDRAIEEELQRWERFVAFERSPDAIEEAARRLADGQVLGWCQGRSEFGPRALGNRSILADPRPPENRRLINEMVKRRESFRPFAPAVLQERAAELFDLPAGHSELGYMSFALPVRESQRAHLGAVTHVDGSARVQVVSKETNPRFWSLLQAFATHTGMPALLNTSFNNNAEPIVDSVRDAVTCLLTTHIDCLFAGDFLATKRVVGDEALLDLRIRLPLHLELRSTKREGASVLFTLVDGDSGTVRARVSEPMYRLLLQADDGGAARASVEAVGAGPDRAELGAELRELWSARAVALEP